MVSAGSSQPSVVPDRWPMGRYHALWRNLVGIAIVAGLVMVTAASVWVQDVKHQESQVCAPISVVPQHVPGGLFPLYWSGVAAVGVASMAAIIAGITPSRNGSVRRSDRIDRWVYWVGAAVLALAAAWAAAMVQSLLAAAPLAAGAVAALVAAIRISPGSSDTRPTRRFRGSWWLVAAVLALMCLVLAGQVPLMHNSIRDSRELCNGGFG
jgi:hypothetical protein